MTDETERARPRRVTSEGERGKRAAVGKLVAAVLVALPGAYAAVRAQSAADEETVATEVKVRDVQEAIVRRHVESLRREIEALRKSAVTHRELLEVVMKLRDRDRVYRPRSPVRRREATASERELETKIDAIRKRDVAAVKAKAKATKVQKTLPKFRPAPAIRKAIKKGDPLGGLKL